MPVRRLQGGAGEHPKWKHDAIRAEMPAAAPQFRKPHQRWSTGLPGATSMLPGAPGAGQQSCPTGSASGSTSLGAAPH